MNMPEHIQAESDAADAKAAADRAYNAARARQYAPLRTIEAVRTKYQAGLVGIRGLDSLRTPERMAAHQAVEAVALEAEAALRQLADMPPDDLEEVYARENGLPSPRALRAGAFAKISERHRKDVIAREAAEIANAPDWSAAKFLTKLARRGVFLQPDPAGRIVGLYGRINASGEVTELEQATIQLKSREILATMRPARRV